ncbi:MAG: hypothetical protein ACT4PS_04545 [Betaproteobacteria bacterium]
MKTAAALLLASCAMLGTAFATAQGYPARTVRIIVPCAAGGNTDITARAIGGKPAEVEFAQFMRDEITKYAKVVKAAGIKPL